MVHLEQNGHDHERGKSNSFSLQSTKSTNAINANYNKSTSNEDSISSNSHDNRSFQSELASILADSQTLSSAERKRGRKPTSFWSWFTCDSEPFKSRSAICRHCHMEVKHHKKSEQAKSHLMRCEAFHRLFTNTKDEKICPPDWYIETLQRRKKYPRHSILITTNLDTNNANEVNSTSSSDRMWDTSGLDMERQNSSNSSLSVLQSMKLKDQDKHEKNYKGSNKLNKSLNRKLSTEELEDIFAMYYFISAKLPWSQEEFEQAKKSFFLLLLPLSGITSIGSKSNEEVQKESIRTQLAMDYQNLMAVVLPRCYHTTMKKVKQYINSAKDDVLCVTIDISASLIRIMICVNQRQNQRHSLIYWKSTPLCQTKDINSNSLDSVNSTKTQEYIADELQHLLKIIPSLPGCIINRNVYPDTEEASMNELQHKFPSILFQESVFDVVLNTIYKLFGLSSSDVMVETSTAIRIKKKSSSVFVNLTDFTILCIDYLKFQKYHGATDVLLNSTNSVPFCKRLQLPGKSFRVVSLEEGLQALLDLGNLLLPDKVSNMDTSHSLGDVAKIKLNLPKILAAIKPLVDLLTLFQTSHMETSLSMTSSNKTFVSDIYPQLVQARHEWSSSNLLNEEEKQILFALSEKHWKKLMHDTVSVTISYLIDPVYCGEGFSVEYKQKALKHLMTLPDPKTGAIPDENQQEQLYLQFTSFEVEIVQVKTAMDSFVFKMLKERKKTPMEYWLTDGRKWPELQAIAFKVFSMSFSTPFVDEIEDCQRNSSRGNQIVTLTHEAQQQLQYIKCNAVTVGDHEDPHHEKGNTNDENSRNGLSI